MSAKTAEQSATTDAISLPRLMRKVRGNAKLEALNAEQQACLHRIRPTNDPLE